MREKERRLPTDAPCIFSLTCRKRHPPPLGEEQNRAASSQHGTDSPHDSRLQICFRRAGTSRRPYTETSGPAVGATCGRLAPSPQGEGLGRAVRERPLRHRRGVPRKVRQPPFLRRGRRPRRPDGMGKEKSSRKRIHGIPPFTRRNITHEEDTSYRNG